VLLPDELGQVARTHPPCQGRVHLIAERRGNVMCVLLFDHGVLQEGG
jgi:hypothetical protein